MAESAGPKVMGWEAAAKGLAGHEGPCFGDGKVVARETANNVGLGAGVGQAVAKEVAESARGRVEMGGGNGQARVEVDGTGSDQQSGALGAAEGCGEAVSEAGLRPGQVVAVEIDENQAVAHVLRLAAAAAE